MIHDNLQYTENEEVEDFYLGIIMEQYLETEEFVSDEFKKLFA